MATKKDGSKREDRILMIVESPNKVKTLQSIFKQAGITNIIVMASVGHISEIKDTKASGSYHNTGIYPKNNFEANYVVSADKKEVVEKLKEQVQLSDLVYVASDDDREGEAIAWSLIKFLKIPKSKYRRATFHEITKKAVLDALNNPRDIDENLVEAAHARQKLDKLMGYRLSPIAKRCVRAKSVGRCQSAGLKIIADREREIQNFIPETYYDISLRFSKNMHQYKARYVGTDKKPAGKINDQKIAEKISTDCKGKTYKICNVETKEKISSPKPSFTTSTFQQEVASKLGIGVKKSMSYAQTLFEGIEIGGEHVSLVTYLRTDSPEISAEFLPVIEKYIKSNFGEQYYAPMKKAKKSETAQEGHEAFRVVDLEMTPEKLSKYVKDTHLQKVYGIIYKRTVAALMSPAIFNETVYTIENGDHRFSFTSSELKFDGYKKMYSYQDDEEEELSKDIFAKGEVLEETSLECIEKKTNPPSRYKEASFIKKLEDTSIGRPSTYATIVSTILDKTRGYCTLESDYITPTDLGMKLADFVDKQFPDLINLNYTRDLEANLDQIASGKMSEVDFLTSFYTTLESGAKSAKPDPTEKKEYTINENEVCPNCGAPLYLRTNSRNGTKFWGCSKFPRCKTIVQFSDEEKE